MVEGQQVRKRSGDEQGIGFHNIPLNQRCNPSLKGMYVQINFLQSHFTFSCNYLDVSNHLEYGKCAGGLITPKGTIDAQ